MSAADRPKFRSKKNEIATNVLGVCSPDMQFIYVLPGWEGSAADLRVLQDAISRLNGLKVPQGKFNTLLIQKVIKLCKILISISYMQAITSCVMLDILMVKAF